MLQNPGYMIFGPMNVAELNPSYIGFSALNVAACLNTINLKFSRANYPVRA